MIFSRGRKQDPVVEFWAWWPTIRPAVTAAISTGGFEPLTPQISKRVAAMHKDLTWEFSKGGEARHALVVSPGGNPALRALVARWGALAPAADPEWEFHTARQPDHDTLSASIEIAGAKLDLEQLRFAFTRDEDSAAIDVVGHHPLFRKLPEPVRGQITFLSLDWLLGEEGVELWIGAVDFSADEPAGARDPLELAAAVDALREEYREPKWVVFSGTRRGDPVTGLAQRPLRAARWPRFDTHVAVTLQYSGRNGDGLPSDEALDALRAFEDGPLEAALHGDGEMVALETSGGARTLHYYVDGESAAGDDLTAAAGGWPDGKAKVKRAHDPGFEAVGHLS
ncbi:DUF695 domain-containing protein [Dactylosporangium sp. NPDC005555]|uniref:DUF695 domain-containing protein n=1 Tax=Dactylosporangium sp. NPDC005555 TaxID=3154889 RepID=UPI0033ABC6DD